MSETDCDAARAAIKSELGKMDKCVKTLDSKECVLGRVFQILGTKGEELGKSEQQGKARIVFQGSNVRTKTGTTAADLYEESSNAPASFAAPRCGLAVASLKGLWRYTSRRGERILASID